MLKAPLLKADLSRWVSTSSVLSIGKYLPLLIAPFALLWSYGKIQSVERHAAEQRVEQLTSDVRILSRSLAQVEQYNKLRQVRMSNHANDTRVLNNEKADVLDMPAPGSIIAILRPLQPKPAE